jgi:hypothetical protein
MAMWRTGQKGYFAAKGEIAFSGGEWTINRLIQRLCYERFAAFARGFLFYLYETQLITHQEADIVMWQIFREHWLASFPKSILEGYRPYYL